MEVPAVRLQNHQLDEWLNICLRVAAGLDIGAELVEQARREALGLSDDLHKLSIRLRRSGHPQPHGEV